MITPVFIVRSASESLAVHLKGLAQVYGWLVWEKTSQASVLSALRPPRPTVFFWEIDANSPPAYYYQELAELSRNFPCLVIVILSSTKVSEDDQPLWTARHLEFGVSYLLFPPWTKLVLEDLAGGLMNATIRRFTGKEPPPPLPRGDVAIDLAEGAYEDD